VEKCSYRQPLEPKKHLLIGTERIQNETDKLCYVCTALVQILDKDSPFYEAMNNPWFCGLEMISEADCLIARSGFSTNPEKRGSAFNEYNKVAKKISNLQSTSLEDIKATHGPLSGMPVFYQSNEIMRVERQGGERKEWIIIYTEDPENPGKLNKEEIHWKDYIGLLVENEIMNLKI